MLRFIVKIMTLPVVLPIKFMAGILRPRRRIKKRALLAIGVAAAAAAHQNTKKS